MGGVEIDRKISDKRDKIRLSITTITLALTICSCSVADPATVDGLVEDKGGDLVIKNSMYKPPTREVGVANADGLTEVLKRMDNMKAQGIWSVDGEKINVQNGRQDPGSILDNMGGPHDNMRPGEEKYMYKGVYYPRNDALAQQLKQILPPMGDVVPAGTRVTSGWGIRLVHPVHKDKRAHQGLDFGVSMRTPITAGWGGTVKYTGYSGGYGHNILIDHGGGLETRYAHLNKIEVTVGQRVETNQQIALSGNSGVGTGAHLHYEIRYKGLPRNPYYFFQDKNVVGNKPYNTDGW